MRTWTNSTVVLAAAAWLAAIWACGGDAEADAAADAEAGEEDAGSDEAGEADAEEDGEAEADAEATPCERATEATVETVAMLSAGRYSPAAAVLEDGRALIAGGYDFVRGAQRSAELFDPATGTLAATGSLRQGRNFPAVALWPAGAVLVFYALHLPTMTEICVEDWPGYQGGVTVYRGVGEVRVLFFDEQGAPGLHDLWDCYLPTPGG
jgi:hypothetical protein